VIPPQLHLVNKTIILQLCNLIINCAHWLCDASFYKNKHGGSVWVHNFSNESTANLDIINDTYNFLILKIKAKFVDYMVSFISQIGLIVFE
jgi:hypothetical protein